MRHLLVTVLFLLLPVAAGGCVEDVCWVDVSFPMLVEVTISVAGTAPLAGDDLVINDTFVLQGSGEARYFASPRSIISTLNSVNFGVSGGGVSATGSVENVEILFGEFRSHAFFGLVTPLYDLAFGEGPGDINVRARQKSRRIRVRSPRPSGRR